MTPPEYDLIDKVYGNFISFQEVIQPVISKANSRNKLNILEIGTGTGITTKIILNSNSNINLTSIDIDKDMIAFTSQNLPPTSNTSFFVSDAVDYLKSIANNRFDFIVSGFTIHNFNKDYRKELFKSIYVALKNNGYFLNADKFVSDQKEKRIEGLKYRIGTYIDTLMQLDKLELLKEWTSHYIEDQRPNKLLKFNETLEILTDIGFVNSEYIFKSEIEMLGVLKAQKRN